MMFQPGDTVVRTTSGVSGGSTLPASGGAAARRLRIVTSAACHIAFGAGGVPTATTSDMVLVPQTVHFVMVGPDKTHYATIDGAGGAGGIVSITACESVLGHR